MMRTPVQPGDQLDHYHIEGIVALSSAASVFRGTDLRSNRQVAIKIPHFDIDADPVLAERFQREEEIGESLAHPGIMKVFADDHRSQKYLVTEWFEGKPLRLILAESRLSQERALRIAVKVCNTLGYIQDHGVVHRDLKPENILVDDQDNVKLINFGLAAQTGARRITFAGLAQLAGMTEYLSPEELHGKRGDARSDIYALGVILYEMLTGRPPFHGDNPYEERKNPVPPCEINPAISPQLQEVIYRALEPEPRHRYANAYEFAKDLRHLDQVGVAERPELTSWKKQRTPQWKRALFFAAIALVPALIFVLLLYFSRR